MEWDPSAFHNLFSWLYVVEPFEYELKYFGKILRMNLIENYKKRLFVTLNNFNNIAK